MLSDRFGLDAGIMAEHFGIRKQSVTYHLNRHVYRTMNEQNYFDFHQAIEKRISE